jgi:hypothetical protein
MCLKCRISLGGNVFKHDKLYHPHGDNLATKSLYHFKQGILNWEPLHIGKIALKRFGHTKSFSIKKPAA